MDSASGPIPSRFSQIPKKLDGFVAISRAWTTLGRGHTFSLPKYVKTRIISSDRFKGVECLKGHTICSISLYHWSNLQMSQLICVPKIPNQRRNVVIDFDKVRDAFAEAVDEAVILMGKLSKLYSTVKIHTCCKTYKQRIGGLCMKCKGAQRDLINVCSSEIEMFGQHFSELFQQNMEQHFATVKTWLCFMETGQDEDYRVCMDALSLLNLTDVHEVVIHIAADIQSPHGQVYFWRRDKVNENLKKMNRRWDKYHTAFISKVGNFVLHVNEREDSNSEEYYSADCQLVKLYSNFLRDLAKNDPIPFSHPVLAEYLSDSKDKNETFSPNLVLEWITDIKESINIIREAKCNTIRCEAIISIINLDHEEMDNTIAHVTEEAKDVFDTVLCHPLPPFIETVQFPDLDEHIRNTLEPLLNTVQLIVEDFLQKKQASVNYVPPFHTFVLASICECLICYYIYGNATYRENKQCYSKQLVKALGLEDALFKDGPANTSAIIESNYYNFVFLRLDQLGHDNGYRVEIYEHDEHQLVRYKGSCSENEKRYLKELHVTLGEIDYQEFILTVENFPRRRSARREKILVLCRLLWNVLQEAAFDSFNCPRTLASLCDVVNRVTIDLTHDCSRDFVKTLFEEGCIVSQPVQRFISIITRHLTQRSLDTFIEMAAKYIEKIMYEDCGSFIFPAPPGPDRLRAICLLPMFKLDDFDYDVLPDGQKNKILQRYKEVYRNLTGYAVAIPGLTRFVGKMDWTLAATGFTAMRLARGLECFRR